MEHHFFPRIPARTQQSGSPWECVTQGYWGKEIIFIEWSKCGKFTYPEVTQQEMLFKLARVNPKIPQRGCKSLITFDVISVDGKLCRHEHIGGGGVVFLG